MLGREYKKISTFAELYIKCIHLQEMIKKIISNLLIVLILALTIGISVFRHYCACSNTLTTSILVEPDCISHQNHLCEHNYDASEQSCCSHIAPKATNDQEQCDASDCCKTDKKFLIIETEYQPSSFKLSEIQHYILVSLVGELLKNPADKEVKLFAIYTDQPPPIFGRKLLTAMHQLKIEIPVC